MNERGGLPLDLLACFIAVVESGGFTAAGRRLGLTQSAITLKVQRLEAALGSRVFTRTSRSLRLTAEGEILLGYARRLQALHEEMMHRVREPSLAGELRLGVAQYVVPRQLPSLLSRFRKSHPRVRLNVEVGLSAELFRGLDEDRFDLVIATRCHDEREAPGERHEQILTREPLVWVGGPGEPPPDDPIPLALLAAPCRFRTIAVQALERAGRRWQPVYTSRSVASIEAAVRSGFAVALLTRSAARAGMEILGEREGFPALPFASIVIAERPRGENRLTSRLSAFITEALQQDWAGPGGEAPERGAQDLAAGIGRRG